MEVLHRLLGIWQYVIAIASVLVAVIASGHAVLYKRDSRATILWVGFIWLAPLAGAMLYFLLGINRIRRRAVSLRRRPDAPQFSSKTSKRPVVRIQDLALAGGKHLGRLARLVDRVVSRPLLAGNRVEPLVNGDEAFPAMIDAIHKAQRTLSLSTYIFDRGRAGDEFIEALAGAQARGVEVRVLIDDTGARYSWPSSVGLLRKAGVPVARFLPTQVPFGIGAVNLRTHRKIMVADGHTAFTGGINIRDGNLLKSSPRRPVQDLHFKIRGPVVAQLQEVFADDWLFTTREDLDGDAWFPVQVECGSVFARAISDGPDQDFEKFRWILLGALASAHASIQIVTPYFLPDQGLISALNVAALRGVVVDILLPSKNNLPFVQWATSSLLWQLLQHGCRVWLTAPPFDHSKLMLVDQSWALLGSANWDPRSLRLNFELNVECYNDDLAAKLKALVQDKLRHAERLTLERVNGRSLPVKLRDGVARLFTPVL